MSYNSDKLLIDKILTIHGKRSLKLERKIQIGLYFIIGEEGLRKQSKKQRLFTQLRSAFSFFTGSSAGTG